MNQPMAPQPDGQPGGAVEDRWGQVPQQRVPLILSEQPANMGSKFAVQPGRALLFSDDSGRLVQLTKRPKVFTGWRYSWRYEVDMSDHFVTCHLEVPSKSLAAKFRLTVDVGWRVTDPARIVNSRILDGNAIVRSQIIEALLPICRSYTIEEDGPLEQNLAGALGGGRVHTYPEGISLFRFSAQVDHGEKAAERIADRVEAGHKAAMTKAGMEGLREQVTSEADLVLLTLQRNPDKAQEIINDIRKRKEMSVQARIDLFNKMVENDLIQEAEIDSLRQLIIQPIGDIVSSSPTGMFGIEQLPDPGRQAIEQHATGALHGADDDEDDIMPAQIVEGSVDGVSGWRQGPWQHNQDHEGA